MKKKSQDWALQRIEFVGQTDSAPYYSSARILLLTSNYEGTPMVITEAMAAGVVPIVMNTFKDADLNIKNGYKVCSHHHLIQKRWRNKFFNLQKINLICKR